MKGNMDNIEQEFHSLMREVLDKILEKEQSIAKIIEEIKEVLRR